MPGPRGVEERIRWFLSNSPGGTGMCARHSWHSLGGDYGNPPAWDAPDANAVYDKVKASGRYFTTVPPRGALVVWKYGRNGHAAISAGNGRIVTTDPHTGNGRTGEEPISYPNKWGARSYIWTDQYNGVKFDVGNGATVSSSNDDFISLKETGIHRVRTNTDIHIDVAGHTNWEAEVPSGRHMLALYANVDLPAPGTPQRDALWYGGIRTWYNQIPENDITGLNGPVPCARFGNQHQLIAHTWPHTVDRSNWEFCLRLYAFDAQGNEMNFEVELETREIKIIGDKT